MSAITRAGLASYNGSVPHASRISDAQAYRNLFTNIIYLCIHDALYDGDNHEKIREKQKAVNVLRSARPDWRAKCAVIDLNAYELRDRYLRGELKREDFWNEMPSRSARRGGAQ